MATQDKGGKKVAPARKKTAGRPRSAKPGAAKPAARKAATTRRKSAKPEAARQKPAAAARESVRSEDNSAQTVPSENKQKVIDRLWHLAALVAFALIAHMALLILLFPLALLQFIVMLIDDKPNSEVQNLLNIIKAYIVECLDFVIFRSEQMPFPFHPLPKPARD